MHEHLANKLANGHDGLLPRRVPEAYLANLSEDNLILTALLPSDATAQRNLVLGILDKDDLTRLGATFPLNTMNRERVLRPGEVAQITLRQAPTSSHVSLFRVRKERGAGSSFVRYAVEVDGTGTLTQLGTQECAGRLENVFPHLLYVW